MQIYIGPNSQCKKTKKNLDSLKHYVLALSYSKKENSNVDKNDTLEEETNTDQERRKKQKLQNNTNTNSPANNQLVLIPINNNKVKMP